MEEQKNSVLFWRKIAGSAADLFKTHTKLGSWSVLNCLGTFDPSQSSCWRQAMFQYFPEVVLLSNGRFVVVFSPCFITLTNPH